MYLTQGLHRSVQQRPTQPMTIFGGRVRSFAEAADRVARLAGALRKLGIGEGDRVALLSLNSDRYSETLMAVPWADAVLNPVNVRLSAAEISYILKDSATRILVIDDNFVGFLPFLRSAVGTISVVIYAGEESAPDGTVSYEELVTSSEPIADARRGGSALVGLFYTGGTTGFPKGVMLSHDNLGTSWLGAAASGLLPGAGSRTLHVAPLFHLACLSSWGTTLLAGGTHIILSGFDPAQVFATIEDQQVTDVLLVPTMIQAMIDHPGANSHDLGSLRNLFYGASPIPGAVLERAMKAFPNASFAQGYGMTELAPVATLLTPADHDRPHLLRSAGRAAPHAEVRVVDENGADAATGEVGEIVVGGGHVMTGYWNQPEATANAVRDGWMHTGDVGYLDDEGYLFIVDRLKDMIVTGGENVYSAEVENAIASHPSVAQCAVIGVPDAKWGERVHAIVVLRSGCSLTTDQLRVHVKTLIAGYKAPRSLEVVDSLPLSGVGKVVKRDLRSRHWSSEERQVN